MKPAAGAPGTAWWTVLAMSSAQALVLFDITSFGVALADMRRSLDLSPAATSWVVNAYVLAYAACAAVGGRLADRMDRMMVFRAGMAVFLAGSIGCGLTPADPALAAPWLIACRILQGVGGALMVPAAGATVIAAAAPSERGRAMSVYLTVGQVFFLLGPTIGGVITQSLSWRWIFFIAVPICVAAAAMTFLTRPAPAGKGSPAGGRGVLHWTVLPLVVAFALPIAGLERGNEWGWLSVTSTGLVVAGTVLLAWLIRRDWRAADPLVEWRLFASRSFASHATTLFLLQMVNIGVITFAPYYFQKFMGLSPTGSGFATLAFVGAWVAAVPVAGYLHDRAGPAWPKTIGGALVLAGMAWWSWLIPDLSLAAQIPAMVLAGAGTGLSLLPSNTSVYADTPDGRRAAAVGLVQTLRQFGGAISVAVLGGLLLSHALPVAGGATPSAIADVRAGFLFMLAMAALNMAAVLYSWRWPEARRG